MRTSAVVESTGGGRAREQSGEKRTVILTSGVLFGEEARETTITPEELAGFGGCRPIS